MCSKWIFYHVTVNLNLMTITSKFALFFFHCFFTGNQSICSANDLFNWPWYAFLNIFEMLDVFFFLSHSSDKAIRSFGAYSQKSLDKAQSLQILNLVCNSDRRWACSRMGNFNPVIQRFYIKLKLVVRRSSVMKELRFV